MATQRPLPIDLVYRGAKHRFVTVGSTSTYDDPLENQVGLPETETLVLQHGNVGIGTSTVLGRLHVEGTTYVQNVLPVSCNTYDLGSADLRWRDLYLSGNTIDIGGVRISLNQQNNLVVKDDQENLKQLVVDAVQIGTTDPVILRKSETTNTVEFVTSDTNQQIPFDLGGFDASRAIVSDASGMISVSAVTSNELLSLTGITGNVQSLLNSKLSSTGGTITGSVTVNGTLNTSNVFSSNLTVFGTLVGSGAGLTNLPVSSQWVTSDDNIYVLGSNVGIGTVPQYKLHVEGDVFANEVFTTSMQGISDMSLKDDVATIDAPLAKIADLRGVNFVWKHNMRKDMGMIAQEVEQVVPEVISELPNGNKTIGYANLVGLLVEGIKQLQNELQEVKTTLTKHNLV